MADALKILTTADLHYPWCKGRFSQLEQKAAQSDAAVLVVAGDTEDPYSLHIFDQFKRTKLVTAGNHDLWVSRPSENSFEKYRQLGNVYARYGFHFLDEKPMVVEDVGFVGNIGWYDYSFRMERIARSDIEEIFVNGKPFHELTEEDYAKGVFQIIEGMRADLFVWNDKQYIHWRFTDKEFLEQCLEKLERDIREIEPSVDQICAVIHHIPFEGLVKRNPSDVGWTVGNAYVGSARIGELLLSHPKVRTVITGHTHIPRVIQVGHITAHNVSRPYGKPELTEIVLQC
ncbi:metallophosphoesterase [Candidatus Woesearchaeota archaeon]|nr:metallophosphoesterase [Candidatus Woesearchaeota archaeon]